MKSLLLPLIAAIALPTAVNAEWEIQEGSKFKTKFLGCYGDICQHFHIFIYQIVDRANYPML